jgi:uncharacterized alpha/beta hydrolase family protein
MTLMIAAICVALMGWIVDWVQRRCEQWSEAQTMAKAQGDTGKGESPRIWVRGFRGWLM